MSTARIGTITGEESDGFAKSGDHVRDFFVGFDAGKAEPAGIIDCDVDRFDAGTFAAIGAIAGAAKTGADEAPKLLNIEMEEFAWRGALRGVQREAALH